MSSQILDSSQSHQKLQRIALEILERTSSREHILLAGIQSSGFALAKIIAGYLNDFSGTHLTVYSVQINKPNPLENELKTDIEPELLSGATLILIDDVQNSGRTLAYALKHFLNYPVLSIQTCVLVDRRHNFFPVKADYIGLSLSTTLQEHVQVEVLGEEVTVTLR